MRVAERLSCPPWELDPDPTATRWVWMQRQFCINEAEAIVDKWLRSRQPKPGRR